MKFLSSLNKVQNKIFMPFFFVMILIGALTIYAMTNLVSANVETRVNEKLRNDVRLTQEIFGDLEQSLAFYAQFIADAEKLAGHISEERDSRLVLIYLLEFMKENQIYSNIGGGNPLASGDVRLNRLGGLGIRTTGFTTQERSGGKQLALSAVAPIEGRVGSRSFVTASREMNRQFLQDLQTKTGSHRIQIYYGGELRESSSVDNACDKVVGKILTPQFTARFLAAGGVHFEEFDCEGHSVKMILAPISINYQNAALVAVFESMDDLAKARKRIIMTTVFVVGIMLLIIIPIYRLTVSHTVGPIMELSRASKAVADGDLNQYVLVKTKDEVGNLSESFNRMIDDLKQYREDIERWNQTLEERVARRTQELAEAQARLIQSEKLAAVGELAAGIAHELNNPLAGIYAFLQVFVGRVRSRGLRGLSEEETLGFQENLVHVEREIQRCKSIIGSLLSFARVSEKDFSLVNLNMIIKETLAFAQSNLRKSNVRIRTHLDENIPSILGNPNELQQVCLNIIVNAGKAMPEGGDLVIKTGTENDRRSVYVSVSDSGCGIEEENLERIFDPFFTTSRPGEGTGLGLSISYSIVREHRGEILVQSKVGEGTTFTILLPFAVEAKEDSTATASIGITDERETAESD